MNYLDSFARFALSVNFDVHFARTHRKTAKHAIWMRRDQDLPSSPKLYMGTIHNARRVMFLGQKLKLCSKSLVFAKHRPDVYINCISFLYTMFLMNSLHLLGSNTQDYDVKPRGLCTQLPLCRRLSQTFCQTHFLHN